MPSTIHGANNISFVSCDTCPCVSLGACFCLLWKLLLVFVPTYTKQLTGFLCLGLEIKWSGQPLNNDFFRHCPKVCCQHNLAKPACKTLPMLLACSKVL